MGLANCPQCWNTPCTCGHDYKDWSITQLKEQITMLQSVLAQKQAEEKEPKGIGAAFFGSSED